MRLGIKVQWFLIAGGVVIYLASAFKDGLIAVSILSSIIPAIGGWVLEQKPELQDGATEETGPGN